MKYWLAILCLPWLLAAAPAPLTTGAVRDQYGEPVAGAVVSGGGAVTVTQADGTFALDADARTVSIACAYCEPASAAVDADGIAAVIVRRYRALAQPGPSAADLRSLPYAHAESAISLAPFVVLEQSAKTLPGPRVSYYGASRFGGLLVDDGIPSYDIAAGITPFRTLPAYGAADLALRDPADAFRYGDMAGGGTFFASTQAPSGTDASAAAGSSTLFAIAQTGANAAYAASASGGDETRSRVTAWASSALGGASLTGEALAATDRIDTEYGGSAQSSESAVRVHYEAARAMNAYVDAQADNAGYSALSNSGNPLEGRWSDAAVQAGASTGGAISAFADAGLRTSTGYYDAQSAGAPRVAGSILQARMSAGVQSDRGPFTWRAGAGAFDIAYDGGTNGTAQPLTAQLVTPSISLAYAFSQQWNLGIESGASFRLPALTETYVFPAPGADLAYDRYATQTALLSYTDRHRVRAWVTAMHRNAAGLDNGAVNAAGAAIDWQIAPALSLRAWALHADDETLAARPLFRFGAPPLPVTPASLWFTYEAPGGFRADVIWRRDLIDYRPDPHVDASIGAPLAGPLRWFAASERREGERYFEIGLRYAQ